MGYYLWTGIALVAGIGFFILNSMDANGVVHITEAHMYKALATLTAGAVLALLFGTVAAVKPRKPPPKMSR
jgi:hypothetical protein